MSGPNERDGLLLTCNTGQELTSKTLNMRVWKRGELVALEKIEKTQVQKIRDDTDVTTKVETVPEMDTPVSVVSVMVPKRP